YSSGIEANDTTFEVIIPTDFTVDLLIEDNCINSVPLIFGTAPSATECFDPGLDVSAPPPPPGGAFDGRFVSCNEGLFADYRATNPDSTRIWDLNFQPADGCFPVTISWNPAQLPIGGNFRLVDPFTGNIVNVDMRTTTSYTDTMDLRHLQIKYFYQICADFNFIDNWNMISLPLEVADGNYLSLFPNANVGTLFGYTASGGYFTTDILSTCTGYWLKMPAAETVQVCGLEKEECVVDLELGWNVIGGPNCSVPLSSVTDPGGIIIPGTLFGYNGVYFSATSIDATEGYWVKASAPGTITISCSAEPLANTEAILTIPLEELEAFGKIEVKDASSNEQTLYINGKLDERRTIESFSMPPVPPQGGFDARLAGDYRLSESDEVTIELHSSAYPVSVTLTNLKDKDGYGYVLKEIVDGAEIESHRVVEGNEIVILNKEVTLLKLEKQQALPTQYSLEQNYPNPFNPSTIIEFSLPEAANAKLTIYNALGQKVDELVNTNLDAGYHSYSWDASNVATGIYIYKLTADKFVSVKKMLLLK
ncbi:MAG: T9SS type A sorting domain-containing protein, partial [Ignavibacteria bacterium]|nr:T9SS type A sorting domain-containing protein [Ignavibacteria bacterium]